MRKRSLFVVAPIVTILISLIAFAQVRTETGITGKVTDPKGAMIPGVTVELLNQATGTKWTGLTNDVGGYTFPTIPPGTYTITVEQPGFKKAVVTDRKVQATQVAQVDITLELGELSDTITISAAGAELLQTSSAEISETVEPKLVRDVPLNGRNFFDLAALTPNTSPQYLSLGQISFSQRALNNVAGAGTFVASGVFAGGARDSASNVSIDGSNVQSSIYGQTTQLQSPSTVQEVRIHTGMRNAEFGNGVTAVNVITKSGTNDFHGEVYEFLRNDNLDATPFFTNLAGRSLPEYKQNQYGFTLGGPILRDKLHFFGNYEGYKLRQTSPGNARVPTQELRDGNFSNYRPPLTGGTFGPTPTIFNPYSYDPETGLRQPFAGNIIPQSMMDPVTVAFLKYTPLPNNVIDGIPYYSGTANTEIDRGQYNIRLDWQPSNNTRISGRYTRENRDAVALGLLPFQGTDNSTSSHNPVVNWTQVLGATSTNTLSVSYTRPTWLLGRRQDMPDISTEIGLKNVSTQTGTPIMGVSDFTIASAIQYRLDSTQNTYQLKDDYARVYGNHSLKFGVHGNEKRLYYPSLFNDKGFLEFVPVYTRACPAGNTACADARTAAGLDLGGLGFADYLLGTARQTLLQLPGASFIGHERYYGIYAQDSWRVTGKLTLNYGLRYEYWTPWLIPRNTTAAFDNRTGQLNYALANPLDYLDPATDFGKKAPLSGDIPREGYERGKNNWAPRLGFSYLLTPDTTVRAGLGISYDGNWNMNQQTAQTTVGPFGLYHQITDTGADQLPPQLAKNQFPQTQATAIPEPFKGVGFRVYGLPEYKNPTTYQWSFSLQRRLSKAWAVELDYLGSHTIHQIQYVDLNPPDRPLGDQAGLSLQQRRQFQEWANANSWIPIGWAKYNSFTTSIKSIGWKGLTLIGNYTWAKNLASSDFGRSDIGNTDYRFYDIWSGPASFTPPHRFVSGWAYDLPVGQGRRFDLAGPAEWFLGGWTVSGITEFVVGSPFYIFDNDSSGTGLGVSPPDRVSGCDPNAGAKTRFEWFNTACFVSAPFGQFGNTPLGIYNDPGINSWNMALAKQIRTRFINEEDHLAVRLESFNAFNTTQWGEPDRFVYSSTFGRIVSARDPRKVQISLQYRF